MFRKSPMNDALRTITIGGLAAVTLACSPRIQRAAADYVGDLYADDAAVRSEAAARLIEFGQASVELLDPFESGCLDSEPPPARCANFDLALDLTIAILDSVATRTQGAGRGEPNPAKDMLWRITHANVGDPFDLDLLPAWQRTDGARLRERALAALDRLMSLPVTISAEDAGRLALATAALNGGRWYILSNCAGGSMYSGCNYGSYVFDQAASLISVRIIRYDDPDNVGSGVQLALDAIGESIGIVQASGGFGGATEQLIFYRLTSDQRPLCRLTAPDLSHHLLQSYDRFVVVDASGCTATSRGEELELVNFR